MSNRKRRPKLRKHDTFEFAGDPLVTLEHVAGEFGQFSREAILVAAAAMLCAESPNGVAAADDVAVLAARMNRTCAHLRERNGGNEDAMTSEAVAWLALGDQS